jgi:hypothetical protein
MQKDIKDDDVNDHAEHRGVCRGTQRSKGECIMNLIELDKQIKEHKIIEADGIADGLLHEMI